MDLKDLPSVSDLIIRTDNVNEMAHALYALTQKHAFRYSDIVYGASRSIRLILTRPTMTSISHAEPLLSAELARQISALTPQARYFPPNMLPPFIKGWEIRQVVIENAPAILVWPAWIHK